MVVYVEYAVWSPLGYEPGGAAHIEFYGVFSDSMTAMLEAELRHCEWEEIEVTE